MTPGKCPKCGSDTGVVFGPSGELLSCESCERLASERKAVEERTVRKDETDRNTLSAAKRSANAAAVAAGATVAALFKSEKTAADRQNGSTDQPADSPVMPHKSETEMSGSLVVSIFETDSADDFRARVVKQFGDSVTTLTSRMGDYREIRYDLNLPSEKAFEEYVERVRQKMSVVAPRLSSMECKFVPKQKELPIWRKRWVPAFSDK